MSSYGLYRPGSNFYSSPSRHYGSSPSYGSHGSSYSKPSYTPSSSTYGSSYRAPSREKSVDRGSAAGYTSDYGKSGYTSDYGKSGYASDRSRVGYISDYSKPANTRYSSYSKPSSYSYGRNLSRQNSITSSDRLSRQNSLTGSESLSRHNSITGADSISRHNSLTGADSLTRRDSLYRRNSLSRRDSYGLINNYTDYSRSQSKEEVPKVNGSCKSDTKTRTNCKAPADFTSEESDTEEETESESDDGEVLVVHRGTSPSKETTNGTTSTGTIALIQKEKRPINMNRRRTSDTSCQVVAEDIPARRQRFISSRPTSLYVNKYYPSTNRFSSAPTNNSSRRYSSSNNSAPSPEKSEPLSVKQQLSVDEPVSAGGFSRDASPNESKSDEPNKDFRKSVLNMNVDDNLRDVYGRRQEEMRHHRRRHGNKLSTEQQSSSATPSSSDDERQQDDDVKKRKLIKKSPSRTGVLTKCGSRSKMEAVKKSPSHVRVQRRRDEVSEEKSTAASSSSTSSSSSSSSGDDSKKSRPSRQRRRGDNSSKNDTEDNDQDSKEDAPAVVVHPPQEKKDSESSDDVPCQKLMKVPSSESSDLTSPGEVVHLTFPGRKPAPLTKVDSGRNVAVSVNIADFIKPKSTKKKSSTSSSSEESSSEEEDERSLLTPVVPVIDPEEVTKQPPVPEKVSSSSSSSSEEDSEEEEESNDVSNVQKSATVINVKDAGDKDKESSEESSEEESSEEESEDDTKLKKCPTQVINPAKPKELEKKEDSEEVSSEEESSEEEEVKKSENEIKKEASPKVNGQSSYWPKTPQSISESDKPKKDSLKTPETLNLFIGQCRDIDEMLGCPSPVSPGSAQIGTSSSPVNQQKPFQFQADTSSAKKDESSSSSSTEEESSSDLEEVEASAVKFHDTKPQKPELGAYTEEIDSSAVRIRENKPLNSQLAEEIDSSSIKIREPMHGHISKAPTRKVEERGVIQRRSVPNATYVNAVSQNSRNSQLLSKANSIIEKLNTSPSRDLRRTLFSLKEVFQEEKELARVFIDSGGLTCLVKVGTDADQNHQNYILRALGQLMLYVDGMTGITKHIETLKWLYTLSASKYRIVAKMAVKLLLVFVEYTSANALILKEAVSSVDRQKGKPLWNNIMLHLKEKENLDMELLVFCVTVVNKVADGFNDQDNYYDFVDALEEQGMEKVIQFHLCRAGTDKELLKQLQIYEAVLKHEDGEEDGKPFSGTFVERSKNLASTDRRGSQERRKSRRYSASQIPVFSVPKSPPPPSPSIKKTPPPWVRSNSRDGELPKPVAVTESIDTSAVDIDDDTGITPALRRRRDARNRTLTGRDDPNYPSAQQQPLPSPEVKEAKPAFHSDRATRPSLVSRQRSLFENQAEEEKKEPLTRRPSRGETSLVKQQIQAEVKPIQPPSPTRPPFNKQNSIPGSVPVTPPTTAPKKMFFGQQNRSPIPYSPPVEANKGTIWGQPAKTMPEDPRYQLQRDDSLKGNQNKFTSPAKSPVVPEPKPRFGATPGIVSKAKEGLAGAGSIRQEQKSPQGFDLKKSASGVKELQWDQLMQTMRRPLRINDLDFTDLGDEDDAPIFMRGITASPFPGTCGPPPPPPPPGMGGPPPPPPPPGMGAPPPPPPGTGLNRGAPAPPPWLRKNVTTGKQPRESEEPMCNKKVKTVKLFWKEVKEEPMLIERSGKKRTIWDELKPVPLDTQRLENLFESKAKDIMSKKVQDGGKKNEIIVLDTKRSNAINIGSTKLPPKGAIKAAILKMDTTIMNREGIEKILTTMLPTEEEKTKIIQAQLANPDLPLGSAEQFLFTLASISELEARLKLWAFRLDYETMEKEVAEPLMDLKQAIVEIETSNTLRAVLSTLLSVGNFLNNANAKGFSLEYLSKVPEVKDTVHKHSLLHHICTIVMEKFPDSTNLYSEFGAVTRASKVDFDEIAKNQIKMETECKASWEYLKAVTKHDGIPLNKSRLSDFLNDCAERIIVLGIIHRRVLNRFYKLMVFLGFPSHAIKEAKVHSICKVISEFSLEYRTCRERVQQQIEKAAALKERNKTRGKLIIDTPERMRASTKDLTQDQQLRQLLGESDAEDAKMTKWGSMVNLRGRPKNAPGGTLSRPNSVMMLERCGYATPYESTTDIDDEILESLVKTATAQSLRTEPRTRKKARYADRKSLRRTLKSGLDLGDALGT